MHRQQRTQTGILDSQPLMIQFQYNDRKVVSFELNPGKNYEDIAVRFSDSLADILGFDDEVRYALDTTATNAVSLNTDDVFSMYVYCDLLEHVVVGDTKAPLLRIVDKPSAKTNTCTRFSIRFCTCHCRKRISTPWKSTSCATAAK